MRALAASVAMGATGLAYEELSGTEPRLGPEALNEAYRQCAIDTGFDPEGVQVIVEGDRPVAVKAGWEVPAEVHRPCLVQIGGADPLSSSYGSPSALGECEGVDREPPIQWDPAPRGTDPRSVIEPVDRTAAPGGHLEVTWPDTEAGRLAIPVDTVVQCWNGQEWTPAYVAFGLDGPAGETRAAEVGPGVAPSQQRVAVPGSSAVIGVPAVAPRGEYRVVDAAERCTTDGDCAVVPFEVQFDVGGN